MLLLPLSLIRPHANDFAGKPHSALGNLSELFFNDFRCDSDIVEVVHEIPSNVIAFVSLRADLSFHFKPDEKRFAFIDVLALGSVFSLAACFTNPERFAGRAAYRRVCGSTSSCTLRRSIWLRRC